MELETIMDRLKAEMIESLNLEDMKPEDIDNDAPLFGDGDGLGLDSIDALEIIIILEKSFGVKIANSAEARGHFRSVRSLAEYIAANSK